MSPWLPDGGSAFFWRQSEASDRLECGLLDWYNLTRAPAVAVWGGCLSGCEPETLCDRGLEIMAAFADEYRSYGGAPIEPRELLLRYQLSIVNQLITFSDYIEKECACAHSCPTRGALALIAAAPRTVQGLRAGPQPCRVAADHGQMG